MGKENEDGQKKQEQKQEEIRIVKTETLEQMQEQTLEQGKLSQSQYAYIQNLKHSGEQQGDTAYIEAGQQRMLPVIESRMKETKQQELRGEEEMQSYVAQ